MDHPRGHLRVKPLPRLERVALLAFVAPRIRREAGVPAERLERLLEERRRAVEGCIDREHPRAVRPRLDHLGGRRACGHHDDRREAGRGGIGRQRRGVVARRRHRNDRGLHLARVGDGDRHGPVLQRAGGKDRVVLDVQSFEPNLRPEPARVNERRVALAERDDAALVGDREEFAPAPEPAWAAPDLVRQIAGDATQVDQDLEHATAAGAADRWRPGIDGVVAAGAEDSGDRPHAAQVDSRPRSRSSRFRSSMADRTCLRFGLIASARSRYSSARSGRSSCM